MSRAIRHERQQALLFPTYLDEVIPATHVVRFIDDVVAVLDLTALRRAAPQEQGDLGRPHYPVEALLKVWLYGYVVGFRSTRRLEWACRELPALWWLVGDAPDHNTLWRFWKRHRAEVRQIFRQLVRLAYQTGAGGLGLHAIDGTRIRADVRAGSVLRPEALAEELARLDARVQALEQAIEDAAVEAEPLGALLPPELSDTVTRRARIAEQLAALQAAEATHAFPADPDARNRRQGDGTFAPSYSGQIVVDAQSHLIVSEAVVMAQTDAPALLPLLTAVHETLGASAACTVADAGYHDGTTLAAVAEAQIPVLVHGNAQESRAATDPFHAHHFPYDAATDTYTCPAGQPLTFRRWKTAHHPPNTQVGLYRATDCHACPLKVRCTPTHATRELVRPPGATAVAANRAARGTPDGRHVLARRQGIVERVFAQLKHHRHYQRVQHRTLPKVQAEWSFHCLAYNLEVLFRHGWTVPRPA